MFVLFSIFMLEDRILHKYWSKQAFFDLWTPFKFWVFVMKMKTAVNVLYFLLCIVVKKTAPENPSLISN